MKRVRDPLDPDADLLMVTSAEWTELQALRRVRWLVTKATKQFQGMLAQPAEPWGPNHIQLVLDREKWKDWTETNRHLDAVIAESRDGSL